MVNECSAYGCCNYANSASRKCGITFHKFPKNPEHRKLWTVRVRRLDRVTKGLWKPGLSAVLCSDHFLPEDFYYQFGRKLVRPGHAPSVFSFAPSSTKRKSRRKRSLSPVQTFSDQCVTSVSLYFTRGNKLKMRQEPEDCCNGDVIDYDWLKKEPTDSSSNVKQEETLDSDDLKKFTDCDIDKKIVVPMPVLILPCILPVDEGGHKANYDHAAARVTSFKSPFLSR